MKSRKHRTSRKYVSLSDGPDYDDEMYEDNEAEQEQREWEEFCRTEKADRDREQYAFEMHYKRD